MGTRRAEVARFLKSEDHPHACGDKNTPRLRFLRPTGSSPRVWGQALRVHHRRIQAGIIPTRVGTSNIYISFRHKPQDHPHACGDKASKLCVKQRFRGSSPRVWGQVVLYHKGYQVSGIIPTRVGTSFSRCTATVNAVSSPRVWGQEISTGATFEFTRIIPTRVGTREYNVCNVVPSRDHPHACGDKVENISKCVMCLGSSPRVWGQVNKSPFSRSVIRIIPTRVGTRK